MKIITNDGRVKGVWGWMPLDGRKNKGRGKVQLFETKEQAQQFINGLPQGDGMTNKKHFYIVEAE